MNVILDLTCPEQHLTTKFPSVVRKMLYERKEEHNLLPLIGYNGCPNTGGRHRLEVYGTRQDVTAWLKMVEETFPEVKPEIDVLIKHIRSEFIRGPMTHNYKLALRDIKRQHGYNGELYSRPWFWFASQEFGENND